MQEKTCGGCAHFCYHYFMLNCRFFKLDYGKCMLQKSGYGKASAPTRCEIFAAADTKAEENRLAAVVKEDLKSAARRIGELYNTFFDNDK